MVASELKSCVCVVRGTNWSFVVTPLSDSTALSSTCSHTVICHSSVDTNSFVVPDGPTSQIVDAALNSQPASSYRPYLIAFAASGKVRKTQRRLASIEQNGNVVNDTSLALAMIDHLTSSILDIAYQEMVTPNDRLPISGQVVSSMDSSQQNVPAANTDSQQTYTPPVTNANVMTTTSSPTPTKPGGISVQTSTPVAVSNQIRVTTPTTQSQSVGVGETLLNAFANKPRIYIIPIFVG